MNVHETMAGLLHFARMEMSALTWGFVAVVFFQAMTGKIPFKDLLSDGRTALSPQRLQMLVCGSSQKGRGGLFYAGQ